MVITRFLVEGGVMSSITKLVGFNECGHGGKWTQRRTSVIVYVLQSIGLKWWPWNYIRVLCSSLLCRLGLIRYLLVVKMGMRIWDISSFPRSLSDYINGYYVPWEWQIKDGGFLHSFYSSVFINAKNDESLIMQGFCSSCITCKIGCWYYDSIIAFVINWNKKCSQCRPISCRL